jgi:hypothetical protein
MPAEIRARYDLTPGTQAEFVDEGGTIRLLVRRRVPPSDPAALGSVIVRVDPITTPDDGPGASRSTPRH